MRKSQFFYNQMKNHNRIRTFSMILGLKHYTNRESNIYSRSSKRIKAKSASQTRSTIRYSKTQNNNATIIYYKSIQTNTKDQNIRHERPSALESL